MDQSVSRELSWMRRMHTNMVGEVDEWKRCVQTLAQSVRLPVAVSLSVLSLAVPSASSWPCSTAFTQCAAPFGHKMDILGTPGRLLGSEVRVSCAQRPRATCWLRMAATDVSLRVQQMQARLKGLKVAELRQYLGEFGESGDKLKKAEIINRIIQLTQAKGSPIEKPSDWSLVNPSQQRAPPPRDPPGMGAREGSSARHVDESRASAETGLKRTGKSGDGGLLPLGLTAYTGEETLSGRSNDGEVAGWEDERERDTGRDDEREGNTGVGEGATVGSFENIASFQKRPSQDYVRGGGGGGEQATVSFTRPATRAASAPERVPRRGPGSGKRLSASAAALTPEELCDYLEEAPIDILALNALNREPAKASRGTEALGVGVSSVGPGPQPFPRTFQGDKTSEASGEGLGRKHTADMEICFLGTASCLPTLTRGVSSIALRLVGRRGVGSSTWIFDAGEGTQIQMQKSWVRPSTIDKIFITHLHGDHCFGVMGLMCLIGQDRERDHPLEIYGPAGLRALLRVTLQLTGSRMLPPYRVIELHDIPFLHRRWVREPSSACDNLSPPRDRRFKELDEGENVYPSEDGTWRCCVTDTGIQVVAAAMQHTLPCVGYCVTEPKGEDRLRVDLVEDVVERNKAELRAIYGHAYKKVFKDIKALRAGQVFTMPSGEIVAADDVLVPARPGRKVVILGDTCDASEMIPHALDADIVVHEATNSWIAGLDERSAEAVEKDTYSHGHSTPQIAGDFARRCKAKKLVLTHFSPRYRGDSAEFARRIMLQIEQYARQTSGLQGEDVVAAWDLMTLAIERPGYEEVEEREAESEAERDRE